MRFLGMGIGHQGHAAASSNTLDEMDCDSDIEDPGNVDNEEHRNGAEEDLNDDDEDDTDNENESDDESSEEESNGEESADEDDDESDTGYDDL